MSVQTIERRILTIGSEVRVSGGDVPTITGHAAVFNLPSEDLGGFTEIVKKGAFKESLSRGDDVRALVDHDPSRILGRTSSGTLRVKEDRAGLAVEIDVADTQAGRDIVTSIRRGDVSGMSFGFRTIEDSWRTVDGEEVRELKKADLIDVSPVTFPAYPDTDVSVAQRSLKEWKVGQEVAKEVVKAIGTPVSVLKAKLDMAEAE